MGFDCFIYLFIIYVDFLFIIIISGIRLFFYNFNFFLLLIYIITLIYRTLDIVKDSMGLAISLNKTESLDAVLDDFSQVDIDI